MSFLTRLFEADADRTSSTCLLSFRLLRRGGRPFLLLPTSSPEAATTLSLYAPQTGRARLARKLMRWALRLSVPWPGERIGVEYAAESPFGTFLCSLSGYSAGDLPEIGILAGNPDTPGQRLLLLCFDSLHKPVAVVKVGVTEQARELLEREETFLKAVPKTVRGLPMVRASFCSEQVRAFAMEFYPGDSPSGNDDKRLLELLSSWLNLEKRVAVTNTPGWGRLAGVCSREPVFRVLNGKLSDRRVHGAVFHGDLVPWNIKVSRNGSWTVLDWERGELEGIPGWDWFHYVVQKEILVNKQTTATLVERVETLLNSNSFKAYAAASAIVGIERELVLAYLLNVEKIIKPAQGLAESEALLSGLASRWHFHE